MTRIRSIKTAATAVQLDTLPIIIAYYRVLLQMSSDKLIDE